VMHPKQIGHSVHQYGELILRGRCAPDPGKHRATRGGERGSTLQLSLRYPLFRSKGTNTFLHRSMAQIKSKARRRKSSGEKKASYVTNRSNSVRQNYQLNRGTGKSQLPKHSKARGGGGGGGGGAEKSFLGAPPRQFTPKNKKK